MLLPVSGVSAHVSAHAAQAAWPGTNTSTVHSLLHSLPGVPCHALQTFLLLLPKQQREGPVLILPCPAAGLWARPNLSPQ